MTTRGLLYLTVVFAFIYVHPTIAAADGPSCACTSSAVVRPCHKNTFFIACAGGTALDIQQKSVPVQSGGECAQACAAFGADQIQKQESKSCRARPGQQIAVATTAVVVRLGIENAFPDRNLEKGKYKLAFAVCPGKDDNGKKDDGKKDDKKGKKDDDKARAGGSRCKRGEVVNLVGTGCGKCVGSHKEVVDGRCTCAAGYERKRGTADCVKKR